MVISKEKAEWYYNRFDNQSSDNNSFFRVWYHNGVKGGSTRYKETLQVIDCVVTRKTEIRRYYEIK